jgi:DNA-binding IscR family transcriptional regulator
VLEGEVAPVECTAEDYLPGACVREPVCLSRSIWDRVQRAILSVLDSTTLEDLLNTDARRAPAAHFVPLEALSGSPSEYAHA